MANITRAQVDALMGVARIVLAHKHTTAKPSPTQIMDVLATAVELFDDDGETQTRLIDGAFDGLMKERYSHQGSDNGPA